MDTSNFELFLPVGEALSVDSKLPGDIKRCLHRLLWRSYIAGNLEYVLYHPLASLFPHVSFSLEQCYYYSPVETGC